MKVKVRNCIGQDPLVAVGVRLGDHQVIAAVGVHLGAHQVIAVGQAREVTPVDELYPGGK